MTETRLCSRSTYNAPILSRLQAEWQHMTTREHELRIVRSWNLPGAPIRSLDEVLERCGFVGSCAGRGAGRPPRDALDEARADAQLLLLVALAHHNALAARIVLQRIMPALCAVASRRSPTHDRRHELADELVANAWPVICNYPVERRRHRVAANLVRDIGFETLVRPRRRRSSGEVPSTRDVIGDPEQQFDAEPLDELVGLLREARATKGISQADIDLICQLLNHGRPEHLAAILDVTPRTVRNHRDAVVHRLRNLVATAA